ncbi:hypothetical protein NX722_23665 [Endozoicomonas gorgoniicola]|uniref:Uncharacterized protein n=1 Tax=Endozoicomonas gorgoniicola TaxID=1234144 RepID=A0ABT3N1Q9_9GAMM|nr:hypothetical protein [Endozoicomonas gorgoniicola]MCW7555566.1 hypothetical protein [Endozoicomonas gorgoniicola]
MEVCQPLNEVANYSCHAIQQLDQQLSVLRQQYDPIQHFEDYEGESMVWQAELWEKPKLTDFVDKHRSRRAIGSFREAS